MSNIKLAVKEDNAFRPKVKYVHLLYVYIQIYVNIGKW